MTDLIARIEAAQPSEARELFEEAWLAFHHDGYAPKNAEDTCCLCIRFAALLDAEAYLDATTPYFALLAAAMKARQTDERD